jgi:site-specific DNA-methyltransferase (adenine-specific)
MQEGWKNKLYFGDNLTILREHVPDESVDLIYLDPPFNSQATYNVLFGEQDGSRSQAQITAFEDTWEWGVEADATYNDVLLERPGRLADLLQALRGVLRNSNMMAYLVMMTPRLLELHRVLKPTGSIFLHCDPTASHYLKLLMDMVFDPKNFRNEIVWVRSNPKAHVSRRFPSGHDVLLFYAKSEDAGFKMIYTEHDEKYLETHYRYVEPETGRRYDLTDLTNPNHNRPNLTYEFPPGSGTVKVWRWTRDRMMQAWEEGKVVLPKRGGTVRFKRYLDEQAGTPCKTVWNDIPPINSQAKERLGYPTQKPEALLERIVKASSNEGDLILDPFCGCGTTINVAERLHRRWVGIDITHLAIALIKNRLQDTFGPELSPYEVLGAPKDLTSAHALAKEDRYQFEWWALSLVEARPAQDKKKGADSGIDGYINFFDDGSGKAKKIVVQVKSGHVTASQIRDLKSVVDREKAVIGAFVTLEPPTKPMRDEALSAGHYAPEHLAKEHTSPKIQILTIAELLSGAQIRYPRMLVTTFKKAARQYKDSGPKQDSML